jgi:histidinol phosphatase-like PHP family hydrolase
MISAHNHTTFSDGAWTPAEVIEAARAARLKAVGISDHFATSKIKSVSPRELDQYVAAVRGAAVPFADSIKVYVGAELDSAPSRTFYDEIDYEKLARLDYLLAEYVGDEERGGMPLWEFVELRKRVPCPVGLAHNDIDRNLGHVPARDLAELLVAERVFVELNTNRDYSRLGRQYYRLWPEFFVEFGKAGGALSIGADVHSRISDVGNVADAEGFAREKGLADCLQRWLGLVEGQSRARQG